MKILHVITSLHGHGAQHMLRRLVAQCDRAAFTHEVVSLTSDAVLADDLRALGARVTCLKLKSMLQCPAGVYWLRSQLHRSDIDVIQSWLYHADFACTLLAPTRAKLVWNIRTQYPDPRDIPSKLRPVIWSLARRSHRVPKAIVTNSYAAIASHAALGYARERMRCIANGINVDHFRPIEGAARTLRTSLNLDPNTPLVGMVARYDAQKDHANFLQAATRLVTQGSSAHFVLCGEWVDAKNETLGRAIKAHGLSNRVHCLGLSSDLPSVYSALDVATLSSAYGESFPNVVAESMACGVPTVATDVGDAVTIVGDPRWVVPPRNAAQLATCWIELLSMSPLARRQLGLQQREHVVSHFSMAAAVNSYESLWRDVAQR